jgi:transporter family-2 protein
LGIIISILSGLLMCIQGVWNTRLTEKVGVCFGTTIVQAVGLVSALILLLFVRDGNVSGLRSVNKLYLLGGILGVGIVYTVIVGMSALGPAYATMLILVAQVLGAYLIEVFGLFGTEKVPFQWLKLIGLACIVVGIVVFQWKK